MKQIIILLIISLLAAPFSLGAKDMDGYLIGPGDVLRITVYDNTDLATTARVSADGSIQFPLIGTMSLLNLSVEGVTRQVEALLADGYLVNPQVTVFIEEYRSQKVIIVGHVAQPGVYELRGPTSLLELISMAGGIREHAGDRVTINRTLPTGDKPQEIIRIDLKELLETGSNALNLQVMDNDSVFIAKAGMFYVTGEVSKPDAYKFENGTTVLKAISMAGGFSNIASKSRVRIIRIIDGKEQLLEKVSMHEPVQPDDVIVVPESFF